VLAAIGKTDARAGDEIAHRPRYDDFAKCGQAGNASADVNGEPTDVVTSQPALAYVQPGSDFDAEVSDGVTDGLRAVHSSHRALEDSQHPIAESLDPPSAKAVDLATPFLPAEFIASGLVYDVETGLIEQVVGPELLRDDSQGAASEPSTSSADGQN
jgi:hypothetical protein